MSRLLFALLAVPVLIPLVLLAARKTERRALLAAVLLVALCASLIGYGVAGMSYEDTDREMPLWWVVGLGAVQLEIIALVVAGIVAIARGWASRRRRKPTRRS